MALILGPNAPTTAPAKPAAPAQTGPKHTQIFTAPVQPGTAILGPNGASVAVVPTPTPTTTVINKNRTTDLGMSSMQDILAYLLSYRVNDFYARFMSAVPTKEVAFEGFSMGVTFMHGHHVLMYNPIWVEHQLSQGRAGFDEVRATLAHEAEHIILRHIGRHVKLFRQMSTDEDKQKFNKVSNIAADVIVNDMLRKESSRTHQVDGQSVSEPAYKTMAQRPETWILAESVGIPKEIEDDLTYEWVTQFLMDDKAQDKKGPGKCNGKHGKGNGPQCDGSCKEPGHKGAHAQWNKMLEDMSEEEAEMLLSQVDQDAYEKLKRAVEEHKKSRGTVPGFAESELELLAQIPKVPWKRLLHQFVSRCKSSKAVRTMERPRRRWATLGAKSTMYPGTRKDPTFNILFCIDTSGSMSDTDLMDGLTELQGIQKMDKSTVVTVVEFDCALQKEYKLTYNTSIETNLRGRGGTDFNVAFNRAKELGQKGLVDCLIVYTDGYAPSPELEFRPRDLPVLWCLTEGGESPCPDYGFTIERPKNR